jgi:hypothetical protein
LSGNASSSFELGLSELDAGFWSRAGLAMPDRELMPWRFLKFVSQPEEHTKPSDTSSSGINASSLAF